MVLHKISGALAPIIKDSSLSRGASLLPNEKIKEEILFLLVQQRGSFQLFPRSSPVSSSPAVHRDGHSKFVLGQS